MLKFCISFVVLCAVFEVIGKRHGRKRPAPYNEPWCLSNGGICVYEYECPEGQHARRGLCPEQRHYGIECCNGFPHSERRCIQRGGECMKNITCPEKFIFRAIDCAVDETCCILVS